jgi:hypothetical protein
MTFFSLLKNSCSIISVVNKNHSIARENINYLTFVLSVAGTRANEKSGPELNVLTLTKLLLCVLSLDSDTPGNDS